MAGANVYLLLLSMFLMTPMYLHRVTVQTLGFPRYAAVAGIMRLVTRVGTIAAGPAFVGEYAYYIRDGMAWLVSLPIVAVPCYRYLEKKIKESVRTGDSGPDRS